MPKHHSEDYNTALKKKNNKNKNNKTDNNPIPVPQIQLHENLSYGEILGEADIVVGRTLIEIKTSKDCIITTRNLLQCLLYRYMLLKRGVCIRRIILFNPLLGESYTVHTYGNWKNTAKVWKLVT